MCLKWECQVLSWGHMPRNKAIKTMHLPIGFQIKRKFYKKFFCIATSRKIVCKWTFSTPSGN